MMSSLKLAFIVTVPEFCIDPKLLGGANIGRSIAEANRFFKSLELPESSMSILESGSSGSWKCSFVNPSRFNCGSKNVEAIGWQTNVWFAGLP
jgi:hypothetical protein